MLPVTLILTSCSGPEGESTVLRNCAVYTMDRENPIAETVVFRGGEIIYAGDAAGAERYASRASRSLDMKGAVVLPGLTDAHCHMKSLGGFLEEINLRGVASVDEIRRLVMEAADTVPPGEWITGRGWDQNLWENPGFPVWQDLQGVESHPVFLKRVDGHAVWVNRAALNVCGITPDTPDPEGGLILCDEDGFPTGVLLDEAVKLVYDSIPKPSTEAVKRRLQRAMEECARCGLTGVGDAYLRRETVEAYHQLGREGKLITRIYGMLGDEEPDLLQEYFAKGAEIGEYEGMLTIRAIKLFADGALGSRGALLFEPYDDAPGTSGIEVTSREEMYDRTVEALRHDFQVCTHAIGDLANRNVLDAYTLALQEIPAEDPRLRVEHAQILSLEDLHRFAQMDFIASMQPTHATSDMGWADLRVGPDRIRFAYAWRDLMESGAKLAFGSDFPVEEVNPFLGIYAAVTRQDLEGNPRRGWFAAQCLTVKEAVQGFTAGAAYAQFQEDYAGKIKPGMRADFTIIDRDIFNLPPEHIPETQVLMTIVGGKVVYENKDEG